MTSATVTQLGEMLTNISTGTGNTEKQNGEFAGIFQTAAEKNGSNETLGTEPVKATATEKNMSTSKTADKLRESATEAEATAKNPEVKDANEVEKELETAVEELKEKIAEKLDISVEELEVAMEALGLTDASLFTQEGMTALVMEIEQISTPVELLTNGDAYQALQELTAIANEMLEQVQSDCGITEEQVQEVLQKVVNSMEETQEVSVTESEIQDVNIETEEVKAQTESQTKEIDAENDSTAVENDLMKTTNSVEANENTANHSRNEQGAEQNQQAAVNNGPQLNNTQTVNQTVTDFSQNLPTGDVTTQQIYDQIGEYIKTNFRPDVSEVEMQLNPESLGSLHIHLSSKQGNVTAQFTVQNELVKAALAVQLIQLKENFAEQGIKVDAVEVTVESHAFNQNMQQSSEETPQAQAEAKRPGIRSINLNGDWAEEELTEEEQLVAEMMAADGNTVDYKA